MKQRFVVIATMLVICSSISCGALAQSFPLSQLSSHPKRPSLATPDTQTGAASISEQRAIRGPLPPVSKPSSGVCVQDPPNQEVTYDFKRTWLPLWGTGCLHSSTAFFNTGSTLSGANQAKFLYNPVQSTNQINADLLTVAIPGTELVLSGTGSTSTSTTSSSNGTATSTQSVSTAVSKLLQGGDFNLHAPLPLVRLKEHIFDLRLVPNLGVSINTNTSVTATNTPTEFQAKNVTVNIPIEATYVLPNWKGPNGFTLTGYANAQESGEILGSQLATTIGTGRVFALTQIAFGIYINNRYRIGGQYFYGPQQAFCTVTSTGCTAAKGNVSGIHLDLGVSGVSGSSK